MSLSSYHTTMGLYDKYLSAQDRYYKFLDDKEREQELFAAYYDAQQALIIAYINTLVEM